MPNVSSNVMLHGCLTDVPGIRVGHAQRVGRGWRTGTTVVLLPANTVGSVEVRGGGPGTRETDLLHPTATMQTVHAICLTGGSAYGLAAAHGVMSFLEESGVGFKVGLAAAHVVPIVPAAVIFDLGRGGAFRQPTRRVVRSSRCSRSPLSAVRQRCHRGRNWRPRTWVAGRCWHRQRRAAERCCRGGVGCCQLGGHRHRPCHRTAVDAWRDSSAGTLRCRPTGAAELTSTRPRRR